MADDGYQSEEEHKDDFVSLTMDHGVQKRIICVGDEDSVPLTPPKLSTVHCHYEGKLLRSGRHFDSSRIPGKTKKGKVIPPQPFEFVLAGPRVIKGMHIAVAGMRRGEVCSL